MQFPEEDQIWVTLKEGESCQIFVTLMIMVVGGALGFQFGKKRRFKRPEPKFFGIPL